MHVKPAILGQVIRDPRTKRALPAEGGRVPDSSFWFRRVASGDVVPAPEPIAAPAEAPPSVEPAAAPEPPPTPREE